MTFLKLASTLIHDARTYYFILKLITRCNLEPTYTIQSKKFN